MMDEYEVKKMVADLMEALDAAGEGHPDNEAYEAARRWMDTGSPKPVFNVYVRVSQEIPYRIRAANWVTAESYAESLAQDEYGDEFLYDVDEADSSSTFDFESLGILEAD